MFYNSSVYFNHFTVVNGDGHATRNISRSMLIPSYKYNNFFCSVCTFVFQAPVQLRELLETSLHWDFDIFKLEELTKKRPLVHLGFNLMCHFDACAVLECDERTILNWLTVIEMNYHASNTYHNSTHAADVMQVKSFI